eukprot:COSAG01_NODE_44871_length_414_cov_4.511111_1_plen_85_part_01
MAWKRCSESQAVRLQYESQAPNATTNRGCTLYTQCAQNVPVQYQSVTGTNFSDHTCANVTQCSSGQYEVRAATATADRECAPYSS